MKYCNRCLYPNSKPDLTFNDEGICSACLAFDLREEINWSERKKEFEEIADHVLINKKGPYGCIVPVSGGKDSHYQVIKAIEHGLRPLAVCAYTDSISDIGERNLRNISKLCDLVVVSVNRQIRRKISNYSLITVGDISWAEHVTIFTIPISEAILRDIPLIIWGENPQNEYGGPTKAQGMKTLDNKWLQEFGGLNGLRVADIMSDLSYDWEELNQYMMPETYGLNLKGLFLGHYFPWDGFENAEIAEEHGFEISKAPVESCGFRYENLDNYQTGIHDYFKYIKYGFGRATDLVNNHIRRGRMTREQGIEHINEWDGNYPSKYLGRPLAQILEEIGMSKAEFNAVVYNFTNKKLFDVSKAGKIKPKFKVGLNDDT